MMSWRRIYLWSITLLGSRVTGWRDSSAHTRLVHFSLLLFASPLSLYIVLRTCTCPEISHCRSTVYLLHLSTRICESTYIQFPLLPLVGFRVLFFGTVLRRFAGRSGKLRQCSEMCFNSEHPKNYGFPNGFKLLASLCQGQVISIRV